MKEKLVEILLPIGTFIAGMLGSVSLLVIIKKIIKRAIYKFIDDVLEPKAKQVLPDKKLDRIEREVLLTQKEIMEMRGKRK